MSPVITCPACLETVASPPFYHSEEHPGNSVVLCQTADEAASVKRGDMELLHCTACGFIFNAAYDPGICLYDQKYEETQAHSGVFNDFSHDLATHLLETYQLYNKIILEIGCGKGDFLNLLCMEGNNRGIGYDPSYVAERSRGAAPDNVTFYPEFFPEQYDGVQPDCVVCKMTLEHIPDVYHFLRGIRRAIAPAAKPLVFFQVPDGGAILKESRFWDIYYEHCSYFTRESLGRLFCQCGFQVLSITSGYDDQYLMLEALPTDTPALKRSQGNSASTDLVQSFSATIKEYIWTWQHLLQVHHEKNMRVALWGGGSKAVAFLAALEYPAAVHWVVDINPQKQGKYLPGSGHLVIAPEELVTLEPDIILAMNPIYVEEIKEHLTLLHINCEILPVTDSR